MSRLVLSESEELLLLKQSIFLLCGVLREHANANSARQSGDDSCGVPPVPISNTAVKPTYAESTWLEAAWEDR